jgi:hypothetical protein
MSVSSIWTWCERNISLLSVWHGAEDEYLCVFGLDIVRQEYLCLRCGRVVREISPCLQSGRGARGVYLRPGHRVRVMSVCLRSERGAEKERLCVCGLDQVREEYLRVFGLGLVQKTNVAVFWGRTLGPQLSISSGMQFMTWL